MCGIIGYTGRDAALPYLIDGLSRLEYRGYDSAGVAIVEENGKMQTYKKGGRLSVLKEYLSGHEILGSVGIGHTRWATHGEPSDRNSHPHVGSHGKIALVHNGIIENYIEIKKNLASRGSNFSSDTDTEVASELIETYYLESGDILDAVYRAVGELRGAWALGIICSDRPGEIIAVRKDAPLLIGYGHECNFIASDVTALLSHTRDVVYMDDYEVAVVRRDTVTIYDKDKNQITKPHRNVDWDVTSAEKGGFPHFMLKEIMETPEAVKKTASPRIKDGRINFPELENFSDHITGADRIYIVACGSAYHVGALIKYNFEKLCGIPVLPILASEFRYSDPLISEKTLVVVISQSGETLDSMAALREAKRMGAKTLGIVNVIGSSIAREADCVLYTHAGPEIAVATTKAYSTQLLLFTMLGVYVSDKLGRISAEEYANFISSLTALPEIMSRYLVDHAELRRLAERYHNHKGVFYIGRNVDFALGLEGSLKLKEISYIHSESYAAGELKHGTISLVEEGVLVFAIATYAPLYEKTRSNVAEVISRGADVIMLVTDDLAGAAYGAANEVISVPTSHPLLQNNLAILPLQLFAYYVAKCRGCDIDKPRNLAKSVTVE